MPQKKPIRINRETRRRDHELWPLLLIKPGADMVGEIDKMTRPGRKEGLTPGEIKLLHETIKMQREVNANLYRIYFRMKF